LRLDDTDISKKSLAQILLYLFKEKKPFGDALEGFTTDETKKSNVKT
jgi:hypothetical protein